VSCPLCARQRITEWKYQDNVVWVAKCKSHPDKWLIVLNSHVKQPSEWELKYLKEIAEMLFPGKKFRGPHSIPDHFHLHEV